MTPRQHTALARMSDEEWRLGADIGAGNLVAALSRAGYLRCAGDGAGYSDDNWVITPDGLKALEAAA